MELSFTPEELEIQRTVRDFARREILPHKKNIDKTGLLPPGVQEKFRAIGITGTPFPEEYGGAGGTFTGLIIAVKELAYASQAPAWMVMENCITAFCLNRYGSDAQKSAFMPGLLSLEKIGAFAFTEDDTGSDPSQLKTVAAKGDGEWIINGAKRFITNSGICDHMILFAKTSGGVTAFLVDSKKDGYKAGRRESFIHESGIDNGEVYFEDYRAPEDRVLGEPDQGFWILLDAESAGKIAFCALFAGLAERALDLAIEYANTRTHRGKPIGGKFQMTQFKIARMTAQVEAMRSFLFHVSAKYDRGESVFMDSAALKIFVAESARSVTADAMEIHGAYGLSDEFEIGSLYCTAASAPVVMGSLDIQRVIVAREMLDRVK